MLDRTCDTISPESITSLHALFLERARRSPKAIAYRYYDGETASWRGLTWQAMWKHVVKWRDALAGAGLEAGDRVGVMVRNSPQWVMFEQAALALGLVVVPIYSDDRASNVSYIVGNAGVKLLLVEDAAQWRLMANGLRESALIIVSLSRFPADFSASGVQAADEWLSSAVANIRRSAMPAVSGDVGALASIVYTSGVTGRPKGVMLSHANILANVVDGLQRLPVLADDVFLSILPLANGLERTIGLYAPMMAGATVVFGRGGERLADDLAEVQPTIIIAAPRFFERTHRALQEFVGRQSRLTRALYPTALSLGWRRFEQASRGQGLHPVRLLWPFVGEFFSNSVRKLLGGRLRAALCGGAPLAPELGRDLLALGVPLLQGYGLTEAGPVVSFNSPEANDPASVGPPMQTMEVRLIDGEIQVRGPSVSNGYWNHPQATREAFTLDGWFRTGDMGRLEGDRLYLTGRRQDIIALTTGDKVSPAELEAAIVHDPMFDSALVVGDGRPFLCAVLALNEQAWPGIASALGVDPEDVNSLKHAEVHRAALLRANLRLSLFPGHAKIKRVILSRTPWTPDNGLSTASNKNVRAALVSQFEAEVTAVYGEDGAARIVRLARERRRSVR